ncbi:MAG: hypothetical protein U0R44_04195 [Candidatus Micrarchaeia archaeon]
MAKIRSAAELDVRPEDQTRVWQGIRTTALDQVRQFCERNHIDPGQFMSNMGWLDSRRWRGNVDWRECVNWNSFTQMINENISENRRGLDMRGFRRTLEDTHESYVQNAVPVRRAPARAAAATPRAEEAPEETQVPPERMPRPVGAVMDDTQWGIARRQTVEICRRYNLDDEQTRGVLGAISRSAPENHGLIMVNLRSYVGHIMELGGFRGSSYEDRLAMSRRFYEEVMAVPVGGAENSILALRRGSTRRDEPTRMARMPPAMMRVPAPGQEEVFIYRFTVRDRNGVGPGNPDGIISTFEIRSPVRIENTEQMVGFVNDPPAGGSVSRIARDGRVIPLDTPSDMTALRRGLATVMRSPRLSIVLNETGHETGGS